MAVAAPLDTTRRVRPRLVLWVSVAVGVVAAALIGFFAAAGKPTDSSRLVGQPAPAISGLSLRGHGTVSLTQYAGKWVLVDFAASWCVPCREELPQLETFDETASRYDAAILTVEEDPPDGAALARYMTANHADWAVVQDRAAQVAYGITGIPTVFLVDPEGIVVGYFPSGIDPSGLDAAITKVLRSGGQTS